MKISRHRVKSLKYTAGMTNLVYSFDHIKGKANRIISKSLKEAAYRGNLGMVKWLCAHGAKRLNRAINAAARSGQLSVIEWLHEQGGDIHAGNDRAFCSAAGSGDLETVKWLHKHGAKVDARNNEAIRKAINHCRHAVVSWLVDHGASKPPYYNSFSRRPSLVFVPTPKHYRLM